MLLLHRTVAGYLCNQAVWSCHSVLPAACEIPCKTTAVFISTDILELIAHVRTLVLSHKGAFQ